MTAAIPLDDDSSEHALGSGRPRLPLYVVGDDAPTTMVPGASGTL